MKVLQLPLSLLPGLILVGSVSANTIIVDQAGGPGTDFLDVQSAINSASHGDTIIVRPGIYAGFDLSLGLTILGSEASTSTVISGPVTITNVPGPKRALLTGMRLGNTTLAFNPGHVVLDSLQIDPFGSPNASLSISNCGDVRMYQCTVRGSGSGGISPAPNAVQVVSSRFEAVESFMEGARGFGAGCGADAGNGGDGLWVSGGSKIALFQSTCVGGNGGSGADFCEFQDSFGGNGGNGLFLRGGSTAVVGGTGSDFLRRGQEGFGDCFPGPFCEDGSPGIGVVVRGQSFLRHSGVTITSSFIQQGSSSVQGIPDDPFLERLGTLQGGRLQTFWIQGTPGDGVTLFLGRGPVITIDPTQEMDDLITHERAFNLGVIPASGRRSFAFFLPVTFPVGFQFFAQAATTPVAGTRRLTNSLPVVVRHFP